MELDKHIGDYAAAIVRDADLLLADTANMNKEQKQSMEGLKREAVRFLTFYREGLPYFAQLNDESRMIVHDLRNPLQNIEGYCDVLLTIDYVNLTELQLQLLHQIKTAQVFILNTFIIWVTKGLVADNQPN